MLTLQDVKERGQQHKRKPKGLPITMGYTVHRSLSAYITWTIVVLFPAIHPAAITLGAILMSLAGAAVLVALPSFAIGGLLLFYFGFLLDKVDGEVARLQGKVSLRGAYLDEVYHIVAYPALCASFFLPAVVSQPGVSLLYAFAVCAPLLSRYNRKIALILEVKKRSEPLNENRSLRPLHIFVNWLPFRAAGVIERFDIVLLSFAALLIVHSIDASVSSSIVGLYVYSALAATYLLRHVILNATGSIDEQIKALRENGY